MIRRVFDTFLRTNGIAAIVDRGDNASGTFVALGVLLALLSIVLYGGVRVAWQLTRAIPYAEWARVALGIVLVLALLAAIVSSYVTGNVVLSVYLLVVPVVGVVLVSVGATVAGWTTWDSNPVWLFFLIAVSMSVLGAVAYGIGAGLRSLFG